MPAASSSTTSSIGRSIGSSARNGPSRRAGSAPRTRPRLGAGLLVVGVGAAAAANTTALVVALAIAACVLLYDAWGKRHAAVAPLNMAMCRALNLLLGVAAVPAALASAWPIAAVPLLYIYAVTAISRGEVHGGSRRAAGSALRVMLVSLAGLVLVVIRAGYNAIPALILVAALAWRVVPAFVAARRQPQPATIRAAVKRGVLSLVLLDAALAAAFAGPVYAAAVLATGLVAGWLARMFAVTCAALRVESPAAFQPMKA